MTGPLPGRDPVKPVAARAKTHLSRYGASRWVTYPAPRRHDTARSGAVPCPPRAPRRPGPPAAAVCRRAARASVPDWDHVWDVARSPARCG